MSILVYELIKTLEKEFHLLGSLFNLMQIEKKIIVDNRKEELKQNISAQEKFVKDIADCETDRQIIMIDIALEMNAQSDNLTLDNLIKCMPAPLNTKLMQLKDLISQRMKDIKKLKDVNTQLIKHALNYISFSLEALSDAINKSQKNDIYTPYGQRLFIVNNNHQILNYNA